MFCQNCGTKLSDDAKFCNQCGNKVLRAGDVKSSLNLDSIVKSGENLVKSGENLVKSVDWQGLKDKAGSTVSNIGTAAKDGLKGLNDGTGSAASKIGEVVKTGLKGLNDGTGSAASKVGDVVKGLNDGTASAVKKYLYIAIASAVLSLIFIIATSKAISPNAVKAEVTYASQPEQRGVHKMNNPHDYYWLQDVTAEYKGQTWSKEFWLDSEYEAYRRGDKITLYISNGSLTDYKGSSSNDVMSIVFAVLTLASIGSCAWFSIQYFKKRRQ